MPTKLPDDVVAFESEQSDQPDQTPAEDSNSEETYDEAALEAKVAKSLRAFNDSLSDHDLREDKINPDSVLPDEEDTDSTPTGKDSPDSKEDGAEGDQGSEDTEDTKDTEDTEDDTVEAADEGDSAPTAPILPSSHRRSLAAYGWSDEEIDQNLEVLGEKFIDVASKLHANRNEEVSAWAQAGRRA
ncbi:hypothetical protein LCGC14_1917790, partial [marine sediment metagenome]